MTTPIPVSAIGVPKKAIIEMAYEDCRISGFDFDRTPEEDLMALRRLNTLMSEWPWNLLGYDLPASGEGTGEDLSNLPRDVTHGIAQLLALRLMAAFGKTPPETFRVTSAQSIAYVRAQAVSVPFTKFAPGTIRGAGAKNGGWSRSPFFPDYSVESEWEPQGDPGDLAGIASS
ncbi:tail accessory factor [Sphingopyxis phage VSN-002]|nr:tail accessory factor [Sphingopyxis phage VSN-002]